MNKDKENIHHIPKSVRELEEDSNRLTANHPEANESEQAAKASIPHAHGVIH